MTIDEPQMDQNSFEAEHQKRDRRISEEQRRQWADGLLACLPDSAAYRNACTRAARLADQERLNAWVEEWKRNQDQSQKAE
jgi:hypothetical protein